MGGGYVRAVVNASVKQLQKTPGATNVFAVIAETQRSDIAREMSELARALPFVPRSSGLPNRGTFRLRLHDDGRFGTTNTRAALALEQSLAGWSRLHVSRRSAPLEIWLIRRRDVRTVVVASKLSRGRPRPDRGVLGAELCEVMARIRDLSGASLVLDPFAGSGAIGFACLDAGAKHVWLNDVDPVIDSRRSSAFAPESVQVSAMDFRSLDVVANSVSAIVTDPPWGHFTVIQEGASQLYADFGRAAMKWLAADAPLIVVTGAADEAVGAMVDPGNLRIDLDEHILVNGHKARLLCACRN